MEIILCSRAIGGHEGIAYSGRLTWARIRKFGRLFRVCGDSQGKEFPLAMGARGCCNSSKSFSKVLRTLSSCLFYREQEESVKHLLLLCLWVESIWFGGPLGIRLGSAEFGSKHDMSRALSLVAFSCWQIWKSRCNIVFDHHFPSPTITIAATRNEFKCFSTATLCTPLPSPLRIDVQNRRPNWSPPSCDGVKVNVDASWRQGEVRGFVGVVIRDAQAWCVEVCRLEVAATSVLMAEALTIKEGCALAHLRNFNEIYVESDSKLVISSLVVGMKCIP